MSLRHPSPGRILGRQPGRRGRVARPDSTRRASTGEGWRSTTGTILAISRPRSVTSMVSPRRTRASTSLVWCRGSGRPTACASAAMRQRYHTCGLNCLPQSAGPGAAEHVDLIIRYHWCMRTITATEASRNFSDLLDAIERGETVTITRGHHVVAEMRPARRRTGADLRTALDDIPPPDERFAADIAGAVALLTSEGTDPWAGA
jgi:antitoxin (DNA-binding transcriptional repressor) of toxin-antitoxin stability system